MTKLCRLITGLLFLTVALIRLPASAAPLYATTGESKSSANTAVPETLHTLNQSNAASTFVLTLGNGTDGEVIAYNPTDGMMYHWSGNSGIPLDVMESINLATNVVTNIPQSGFNHLEITPATWDAANSAFC